MLNTQSLKQLALLIRLPNAFTVLSNVIAAYLIGSSGHIVILDLFTLIFSALCFYHGGMILNDCFDISEDRIYQPHRPLASGAISLKLAWLGGYLLLSLGAVILLLFDMLVFAFGVALSTSILAYNLSSRKGYWGCFLMGACRFLLWALVLTAAGDAAGNMHYAIFVGLYVVALTFLSRDENEASLIWHSLACAIFLSLGLLSFVVIELIDDTSNTWRLLLLVCLACFACFKLYRLVSDYRPEIVRQTVMFFIMGLIPLDATLLFINGHTLGAILVLFLIIPGKQLAKKLYVS